MSELATMAGAIDLLRDDDVVSPNLIENLAIYRNNEYAGYIRLSWLDVGEQGDSAQVDLMPVPGDIGAEG